MKLVFFDFDGVLVDTLLMHYEISKKINRDMSLDEFRSISNGNIDEVLKNHPTIKMHPQFYELYEAQCRKLIVPESLKFLLKKLNENYKLAIVSSTPSALIGKILEQADAREYFSDILGRDIHTSKIVKIKSLLEKYKTTPEKTIYITDTIGDIKEVRECGAESIAVSWGFHKKETLLSENPFALVDTPEELGQKIEEFFRIISSQ